MVAPDETYDWDEKSRKCDLCANTPYHWEKEGGGVEGKQACVEVCPVGAIKFTRETPQQVGDAGYKVNLRGESWKNLGYPTE
jgi:protein NrfC